MSHSTFRRITSIINQQLHLNLKNLKTIKITPTYFELFLDHHQRAMFLLAKVPHYVAYGAHLASCTLAIAIPSLRSIRRTPSQLHSQQRIPTQHDMLPQHHVYKNELNCECYNITLTRRNIAPWWWSKKRSKHVGVILIVFKCFYL